MRDVLHSTEEPVTIEEILMEFRGAPESSVGHFADRVRLAAQAEIWDEMRAIDTAQVSVAMQRIDSRARQRLSKGGRCGE